MDFWEASMSWWVLGWLSPVGCGCHGAILVAYCFPSMVLEIVFVCVMLPGTGRDDSPAQLPRVATLEYRNLSYNFLFKSHTTHDLYLRDPYLSQFGHTIIFKKYDLQYSRASRFLFLICQDVFFTQRLHIGNRNLNKYVA